MIKVLALETFLPSFQTKRSSSIKLTKKVQSPNGLRFWLSLCLIAANLVLLISYIYGVNQFAGTGYQIGVLQKRLADLSDSNKKINMQVSEITSMVSIQNDFLSANFVSAGTPTFLQSTQVAQR